MKAHHGIPSSQVKQSSCIDDTLSFTISHTLTYAISFGMNLCNAQFA
jgi:hypothetical protein